MSKLKKTSTTPIILNDQITVEIEKNSKQNSTANLTKRVKTKKFWWILVKKKGNTVIYECASSLWTCL